MEGTLRLRVAVRLQSQAGPGTAVGTEAASILPEANAGRKRLLREVGSVCFKLTV